MDRNGTAAAYIRENVAVVPYVGTWIEISLARSGADRDQGRSLRGNVDRNPWAMPSLHGATGRSLRGNVDRNARLALLYCVSMLVVPYVGTWIEIFWPSFMPFRGKVVPYVGTWIEILSVN